MSESPISDEERLNVSAHINNVSGGVDVDAQEVYIGGDVVGRDKITVGYTVEQVSTLLTQISSVFQPKPFDGRCPYLGLTAFSEDDADRFFGRESLVGELVARVKESRSVVIAGPSGSGKSSLVRAGLIHALKQGALPNSDRWLYATPTPGRDPIESLAVAMSRLTKSPDANKYLREHSSEPSALHELIESQLSDRKDQRAVIFVDQFEEIFTQVFKEDERLAFLNLLTYAAMTERGRVTVLFALRSDFVSNCATYPQLNACLNQQFMQVGAMQPDELVSAIARPALQVGLRIDPDLVAQIVNDMRDEPGALPLMQFALKDLFDARQAKGDVIALTLNDYLARGGLRKALERHADVAFSQLSENEQRLARTIFSGLIEIGRGTQDARRTAAFDELVPVNIDAAQVRLVVQKLADARLITTDKQDRRETVTIAHEALIEAWPWLHRLVNENRETIALQNQIAEDAEEWQASGHDASYLYSGARLATAREDLAGRKIILNELAQQFVEVSSSTFESARHRRRRLIQGIISGLVIISLIFAGLSAWAVSSQQSASRAAADALSAKSTSEASAANEAAAKSTAQANAVEAQHQQQLSRSRELAAVALGQIDIDPERGLLIAIEAEKEADIYEAQDALRQLVFASGVRAVLRGHESVVNGAQFSPDGSQIVTASRDGTARVWAATTGEELAVLRGHTAEILDAQFSLNGKQIATASDDRTARVWNAATGEELTILNGHVGTVWRARFSPDGRQIVTASSDQTARVWDVATGKELVALRGHESAVIDAQFSPDGRRIVTASFDRTARVWDAATGEELTMLNGHEDTVWHAQFSPDGRQIVTASSDLMARVWDVATGRELAVLHGHESDVIDAQFSTAGKQIVTASKDETARVWDAVTGKEQAVLRGHKGRIASAQFSPDGRQVVTSSYDWTARIWDVATGKELAVLRGHVHVVLGAQFAPDGKQIATASADKTARVWDATGGKELAILRGDTDHILYRAQFLPDSKRIIAAEDDQIAQVWDVATGKTQADLDGYEGVCADIRFTSAGIQVVTLNSDQTVRVWDLPTGKELVVLHGHKDLVNSAQFSPDGKQIVTTSWDETARVWDIATGKEIIALRGHEGPVDSAQFSSDGSQIVTASQDRTVRVWDSATGKQLTILRGHTSEVYSAQFSPDGKQVVTASDDLTARVWDTMTGQEQVVLYGHENAVQSAQFSPDGKQIVTASRDGTARVWDAATGQEIAVLRGHTGFVWNAQFSPDGKFVVTTSADAARVYVVHLSDLIAVAQSRVTRELTCEERIKYLHEDIVCPAPTP